MIRGIEKRVRNSFLIKHAYQFRNIEAKETMAYYQNKRSPRFERISQARQWSEEQEENRLQGEKIECLNTKRRFEKNLMVEVKIVEDPEAPLHVGAGRLPDWLRNKKICWRFLIRTPTSFVFSDALRSIKERIPFLTQKELVSLPEAFLTSGEFDRSTKGIFL